MTVILNKIKGIEYYNSNFINFARGCVKFNYSYLRSYKQKYNISVLSGTDLNDAAREFALRHKDECVYVSADISAEIFEADLTAWNLFTFFKDAWIPVTFRPFIKSTPISYNGPKGYFFSFEGVDGCGKSSLMKVVAKMLTEAGFKVNTTREPGGSPLAEQIRNLIIQNEMSLESEALLFFAARHDHYHKTILPAIQAKEIVLSDRFIDSSIVYQGALRNGRRLVDLLDTAVMNGARPVKTFLIEVSKETAKKRRSARGTEDRFDSMDEERFELMAKTFNELADAEPKRFVRVSNESNIEQAAYKIVSEIISHLQVI